MGSEDNPSIEVASSHGIRTRANSKAAIKKQTKLLKLLNKASGVPTSTPISALPGNANYKALTGLEQDSEAVLTKTDTDAKEQILANAKAAAKAAQDAMNIAIANAKAAADAVALQSKCLSYTYKFLHMTNIYPTLGV